MKKLLLFPSLLLFSFAAAQNGWREKEMEIKVPILTKTDAATLHELQLNGEIHGTYGLMDVMDQSEKLGGKF